MTDEFKFNLNRINEALRNRLPSDRDQNGTMTHRLNKMSLVRSSKFRHVYGCAAKKEDCYEGLKITKNAHDSSFCAVNPKFLAVVVESSGGGVFLVLPLQQTGRVTAAAPKVCGHRGPVTDIKWNPFNDNVIASASDDTTIKIWFIPDGGFAENLTEWLMDLHGHTKKVGYLEWHPTAVNILLSAGTDCKCIIWNIETAECVNIISVHTDTIFSMSWNFDGSLFATTCKDKQIRVIDPRKGTIVAQGEGHLGSKSSKVVFLDKKRLLTTGFSRLSERQFSIWNIDNLFRPLRTESIDASSGILVPYYDYDTKVLFIAGKGDGNVRYYEIVEDSPYIHYLCQYQSTSPQRGLGQMPKRGVDVKRCEIVRFYKLHTLKDLIEPLSMIVPRKSELFQEDIFPPSSGVVSSMSAEEWISGINRDPILVSLKSLPQSNAYKPFGRNVDASSPIQTTNAVEMRKVPASVRNISRLSGTDEQFMWEIANSEKNSPDAHGTLIPLHQQQQQYLTHGLDNRDFKTLNNNAPTNENIPKGEAELRKAYFNQNEEMKRLRDQLIVKDVRIRQLEEEMNELRKEMKASSAY